MRHHSAEDAYLFRHAMLREAAHDLMLPGTRAHLHGLVLGVLEEIVDPQNLDSFAAELADHARQAQPEEPDKLLGAKETAYLRRAGDYARRQFRVDESVRHFDRLAAHPHADAAMRQYSTVQAAYASLSIGRHAEAERRLTIGLQWAQAAAKPLAEATMRASIAMVQEQSGRAVQAIEGYQASIPVFREFKETHKVAATLSNLSLALKQTGRTTEAEAMQAEALQLLRELGSAGVCVALSNLANIHRESGRLELAQAEYDQALEICRKASDLVGIARILGNYALLLDDTGRRPEAEAMLHQALVLDRQTGNTRGQGILLRSLARIAGQSGNHAQADAMFAQALHLLRECGAERHEAMVLAAWAELRLDQLRLPEAERFCQDGLNIMQRLKDPQLEGASLCTLSLIYEKSGRPDAAKSTWQRGMSIIDGIGDKVAKADVLQSRRRVLGPVDTPAQAQT